MMNDGNIITEQHELEPVIAAFMALCEAAGEVVTAICELVEATCALLKASIGYALDYVLALFLTKREAHIFWHTKKKRVRQKYRNRAIKRITAGAEANK